MDLEGGGAGVWLLVALCFLSSSQVFQVWQEEVYPRLAYQLQLLPVTGEVFPGRGGLCCFLSLVTLYSFLTWRAFPFEVGAREEEASWRSLFRQSRRVRSVLVCKLLTIFDILSGRVVSGW